MKISHTLLIKRVFSRFAELLIIIPIVNTSTLDTSTLESSIMELEK